MRKPTLPLLAILAVTTALAVSANPVFAQGELKTNQFWWPESLNLAPLRQHADASDPMGENFNYAEAFGALDLDAVKKDIAAVLTDSQDWWPADYGNY